MSGLASHEPTDREIDLQRHRSANPRIPSQPTDPKRRRSPRYDRRYAIDPSRIQRELGWQPRHSLEEGLAETVKWYLTQQDWCK